MGHHIERLRLRGEPLRYTCADAARLRAFFNHAEGDYLRGKREQGADSRQLDNYFGSKRTTETLDRNEEHADLKVRLAKLSPEDVNVLVVAFAGDEPGLDARMRAVMDFVGVEDAGPRLHEALEAWERTGDDYKAPTHGAAWLTIGDVARAMDFGANRVRRRLETAGLLRKAPGFKTLIVNRADLLEVFPSLAPWVTHTRGKRPAPPRIIRALNAELSSIDRYRLAERVGIDRTTLRKVLRGEPMTEAVLIKLETFTEYRGEKTARVAPDDRSDAQIGYQGTDLAGPAMLAAQPFLFPHESRQGDRGSCSELNQSTPVAASCSSSSPRSMASSSSLTTWDSAPQPLAAQ